MAIKISNTPTSPTKKKIFHTPCGICMDIRQCTHDTRHQIINRQDADKINVINKNRKPTPYPNDYDLCKVED